MNPYINLIKSTSLMNSLPYEEIENYLKNNKLKVVSYKKNSIIHFDGEECCKLEIILSGKVVVDRIDESGNLMTITEFYKNDILGGNLLFSKSPIYPMTITSQLPSLILEVDKELLFELFYKDHDILLVFLESLSDNTYILGHKLKHYGTGTIREKLLNYLKQECKIQNSYYIRLPLTKKALAEKFGVQRSSLSRELAKMKKDGLIEFDAKSITLREK